MTELLQFIAYLVYLYEIVIIAYVILQMLVQFNVINYSNPLVRSIYTGLFAVTEPLLRPIRRWLPKSGGVDFAPIVLLLGCLFVRWVVIGNLMKLV
jgi:YggT family protein